MILYTSTGKLAVHYNRDKPFVCEDGKTRVFVALLDEKFRPLPDAKPVLVNPDLCRLVGFQD